MRRPSPRMTVTRGTIRLASGPAALPLPSAGGDLSSPRPVGLRHGKKRRGVFFGFGIEDEHRIGKPENLLGAGRVKISPLRT